MPLNDAYAAGDRSASITPDKTSIADEVRRA